MRSDGLESLFGSITDPLHGPAFSGLRSGNTVTLNRTSCLEKLLANAVLVVAMLFQQEESKCATTPKHEAEKASRKGSRAAHLGWAADGTGASVCGTDVIFVFIWETYISLLWLLGVRHCRLHSLSHPRFRFHCRRRRLFFHEIETLRIRWSTLPTTFFAICI